jgi:hypothetical protein
MASQNRPMLAYMSNLARKTVQLPTDWLSAEIAARFSQKVLYFQIDLFNELVHSIRMGCISVDLETRQPKCQIVQSGADGNFPILQVCSNLRLMSIFSKLGASQCLQ